MFKYTFYNKWGEVMAQILTKESALFFIDGNQYEEFIRLFNASCTGINFDKGLLNEKDVLLNSFNLWLMLQPTSSGIMESMEKTMYYTSDFMIFDALRKNKRFHQLQISSATDEILQCQLACCLANQVNKWLLEKLKPFKNSLLFNKALGNYYLLDENAALWEQKEFLDEVSMYTKQVALALADNRSFTDIFSQTSRQYEQLSFYKLMENKVL